MSQALDPSNQVEERRYIRVMPVKERR